MRFDAMAIMISYTRIRDRRVPIIWMAGQWWLVGAELARAVGRESYNLYRSVDVYKYPRPSATIEVIEALIRHGSLKFGTRSATLIPYVALDVLLKGSVMQAKCDKDWELLVQAAEQEWYRMRLTPGISLGQ